MGDFYSKELVFQVKVQFFGPKDDGVAESLPFLEENGRHDDEILAVAFSL